MKFSVMCVFLGTTLAAGQLLAAPGLPPELAPEVEQAAQSADAAGLPGDRLRTKALEGVAKGVAIERLRGVLLTMRQQMDESAAILDEASPQLVKGEQRRQLVATMVAARQAGVSVGALQSVAQQTLTELRDPSTFEAAASALTDLGVQGYPAADSRGLVKLAVENGFRGTELAALVHAINDLRKQVDAGAALQAVRDAVKSKRRGAGIAPEAPGGNRVDVRTPGAEKAREHSKGRGRDK